MAASRKLQGEIDRCLKKVSEGVETFEDIWQKVHNATNTNQKEKYEADLKKEIKKLQRLRDQIKSWIASGEIKDKSTLVETRKLIETQMERFKVVERETKTKAYSKEGLGAATKLDPTTKEREELSSWLCTAIDSIQLQLDAFDAEIELIMAGKKKRLDKEKQERFELLSGYVTKHKFHLGKLEALLRMLDNLAAVEGGDVLRDFLTQVRKIKDDVEYYLESHQEPEYEENEFMYDDIEGLEEQQQMLAAAAEREAEEEEAEAATASVAPTSTGTTTPSAASVAGHTPPASTRTPAAASPVKQQVSIESIESNCSSPKHETPPAMIAVETPTKGTPPVTAPSPSPAVAVASLSFAAAAEPPTPPPIARVEAVRTPPSVAIPVTATATPIAKVPLTPATATPAEVETVAELLLLRNGGNEDYTPENSSPAHPEGLSQQQQQQPDSLKAMAQDVVDREGLIGSGLSSLHHPLIISSPSSAQLSSSSALTLQEQLDDSSTTSSAHIPPLLGVAPLGPFPLQKEHQLQLQMLEAAHQHMPLAADSERMRQYLPRNPVQTPGYYPQQPLTNTDSLDFFQRLSIETLFFIFYYLEGSKAQYLAAKVLKKQSWRFHTKYMMWFQRHEEPKVINEEYEQGTYIYFDIEKWGQRKKDGFVFEYRYLEDRELS